MINNIIKKAITFCEDNGHRATKPRIEVLKIISNSKKPLKAYDILKKLGNIINNPKPPTVYRAIEFWEKLNFIHKIDSLNAFTTCDEVHLHNGSQFFICNDCGIAIESHLHELPKILKQISYKKTFKALSWKLEVSGLCRQCS